jgi:hypothetical protein
MFFRNLRGCIRRLVFLKPFGDEGHDEDGYKVPVAPADIAGILVETETLDILTCIGQLRTEQTDSPGYLQPKQE